MWNNLWNDHDDVYHVQHKVPVGDSPYVRAKQVQLVDKDPERAIALFWAAINAGDRIDSALKDMAIVMKQQNRPEEAIQAIKSFRDRCSDQAQEPLDNVLLDLYKRCGKLDEQIDLLEHKLHRIYHGLAFNGKPTKTARSQGRKFQVSIQQEASRLLGNLGWAFMQKNNYIAAETVYRKALLIQPDGNKLCNLGICLVRQGKFEEAKETLVNVTPDCRKNSQFKSYERAQEILQILQELENSSSSSPQGSSNLFDSATETSSSKYSYYEDNVELVPGNSRNIRRRTTTGTGYWTPLVGHFPLKLPLTSDRTNKQVPQDSIPDSIWDERLYRTCDDENFPAKRPLNFTKVDPGDTANDPEETERGDELDNVVEWGFTHDPEVFIEFCGLGTKATTTQAQGV